MISQWNVLARFRQLTTIDDTEAENILPLCVVNLQRVMAVINEKADKNDIRIANAAAALTFYDYTLKQTAQTDNVTSFKAGDVTVSKTTANMMDTAETLKKDALFELTPIMKDTDFIFMNI